MELQESDKMVDLEYALKQAKFIVKYLEEAKHLDDRLKKFKFAMAQDCLWRCTNGLERCLEK